MEFGYIRVLDDEEKDQALRNRMLELLKDDRMLFEDIRDKGYTRPNYEIMRDMMQMGDILYIDELDSLGRNYEDMAAEWQRLTYFVGADVVVLNEAVQIDSRRFRELGEIGKQMEQQMLDLLVYMAALQRRKVHDNQRLGIERAKKAGTRFGRPIIERDWELMEKTAQRWLAEEITVKEACEIIGVPRSTWYQYIKNCGYVRKK